MQRIARSDARCDLHPETSPEDLRCDDSGRDRGGCAACAMEFHTQTRFWQTNPWHRAAQSTVWVALPFTLALIPLRLREPRPRVRRLSCQPGLLAAVAVAVSLGHYLLLRALSDHLNTAKGGAEFVRRDVCSDHSTLALQVVLHRRSDVGGTRPERSMACGEELGRSGRKALWILLDSVSVRELVAGSLIGGKAYRPRSANRFHRRTAKWSVSQLAVGLQRRRVAPISAVVERDCSRGLRPPPASQRPATMQPTTAGAIEANTTANCEMGPLGLHRGSRSDLDIDPRQR